MLVDGGGGGVVVPKGEPGQLLATAGQLSGAAASFSELGRAGGIADALSGTTWTGLANVNFSTGCVTIAQGGRRASDALIDASVAVKRYAQVLEEGIEKAEKALQDYEDAQAAYDDASFKLSALGDGDEDRAAANRLGDRASAALGDSSDALRRGDEANQAVSDAAGRAATALSAVAGRAEPLDLSAQPGAAGLVLASSGEKDSAALRVLVFKIGGSESALVERRADGTWTVTMADGLEGGIEADLKPGVEGKGSTETGRLGGGPDIQAALLAQYEDGRTYAFASHADALRYVEAEQAGEPADEPYIPDGYNYASGGDPALGWRNQVENWEWHQQQEPIETYEQGGLRVSAGASSDFGGASATAAAGTSAVLGVRRDHESDTYTEYSKSSVDVSGALNAPGASAEGSLESEAVTSVTRNSDDELESFSISATASGEGSATLGANLPATVTQGVEGGLRHERQVTLDATEPANRDAVQRYLDSGGMDPEAVDALNERLAADGHTDIRTYANSSETTGFEADAKVVGVEFEHEESRTSLLDAEQRLPGSHSDTDVELPGR